MSVRQNEVRYYHKTPINASYPCTVQRAVSVAFEGATLNLLDRFVNLWVCC